MTKDQARALLALIADLYLLCQTPDPEPTPDPASNGREPVAVKT
jgi:hypothetical protein